MRDVAACHCYIAHFLSFVSQQSQLHLCIFWTLEASHGLGGCDYLADERFSVDADNFVARNHSSTFGRPIVYDVLYVNGVASNGELNSDAGERAAQVVVGRLNVLSSDIHRVRVEFRQDLRHSFFHQFVDIHGVNILVVDDM